MQETSTLYKNLLADPNHYVEARLSIGETGSLINHTGDYITVGGFRILVDDGGPDTGFADDMLISMETDARVFADDTPQLGACVSAEIHIELLRPVAAVPRMARLVPYVRLTDGVQHSEWLCKGVFWLDTREDSGSASEVDTIKLHGYDAMLMADVDCPIDGLSWPASDIAVARRIAQHMGISIDSRTVEIMTAGYIIEMPTDYSSREVLGYIAASYGGCFVMSDAGQLRLIQLSALPLDTSLLCTSDAARFNIVVGGDRIRV